MNEHLVNLWLAMQVGGMIVSVILFVVVLAWFTYEVWRKK